MKDRWEVKCREVHMDNSQKYQIWLNGCSIGEIENCFDTVEKLREVFDTMESQQQEIEQLRSATKGCAECMFFKGRGKDIMNNSKLRQEIEQLQTQMIQAARGSAAIVDLAAENVKIQATLNKAQNVWDLDIAEMHRLQAQNRAMREALAKARRLRHC